MGEPTVCEGPRYLHSQTRSPCTRGPSLDAALGLRDKPQGRGRAVRALGTRGGGLGPPGRPASRVFSGRGRKGPGASHLPPRPTGHFLAPPRGVKLGSQICGEHMG